MKKFRILKSTTGYMLVTVSNGKAIWHDYKTYPANIINILLNIGYTEA